LGGGKGRSKAPLRRLHKSAFQPCAGAVAPVARANVSTAARGSAQGVRLTFCVALRNNTRWPNSGESIARRRSDRMGGLRTCETVAVLRVHRLRSCHNGPISFSRRASNHLRIACDLLRLVSAAGQSHARFGGAGCWRTSSRVSSRPAGRMTRLWSPHCILAEYGAAELLLSRRVMGNCESSRRAEMRDIAR
jgi:hypothetical protein